jgi:hypothetical protein
VTFLAGCEADSVELENCPAYIRARIDRGKVEEIGDANNRMRIATRAKQGRQDRVNRQWELN